MSISSGFTISLLIARYIVPLEIVEKLVFKHTAFIFDPAALPKHYSDKHYHLQLPKGYKK